MKRGGSGGGQSSLGYLFGSDNKQKNEAAPPPSPATFTPPYGIDTDTDKPHENRSPSQDKSNINVSNNYHRVQGQIPGNFITDRPSTKVKYAPGGDSSLGYLFGDK